MNHSEEARTVAGNSENGDTGFRDTILSVLAARGVLFATLSRTFRSEPDSEMVAALSSEDFIAALEFYTEAEGEAKELETRLRKLAEDETESTLADLRDEYTRLFVGPGHLVAPFWESVYLDDRELLFTESTAQVRHLYQSEGYVVDTGVHEAEDSLYLQLEFLADLNTHAMDAFVVGEGRTHEFERLIGVQLSFENEHMLDWLPKFTKRAQESKTHLLYPQLAQAVEQLISYDVAVLADVEGLSSLE